MDDSGKSACHQLLGHPHTVQQINKARPKSWKLFYESNRKIYDQLSQWSEELNQKLKGDLAAAIGCNINNLETIGRSPYGSHHYQESDLEPDEIVIDADDYELSVNKSTHADYCDWILLEP